MFRDSGDTFVSIKRFLTPIPEQLEPFTWEIFFSPNFSFALGPTAIVLSRNEFVRAHTSLIILRAKGLNREEYLRLSAADKHSHVSRDVP